MYLNKGAADRTESARRFTKATKQIPKRKRKKKTCGKTGKKEQKQSKE